MGQAACSRCPCPPANANGGCSSELSNRERHLVCLQPEQLCAVPLGEVGEGGPPDPPPWPSSLPGGAGAALWPPGGWESLCGHHPTPKLATQCDNTACSAQRIELCLSLSYITPRLKMSTKQQLAICYCTAILPCSM